MPSCSIKCPKVRRDLSQAIAEGRVQVDKDGRIISTADYFDAQAEREAQTGELRSRVLVSSQDQTELLKDADTKMSREGRPEVSADTQTGLLTDDQTQVDGPVSGLPTEAQLVAMGRLPEGQKSVTIGVPSTLLADGETAMSGERLTLGVRSAAGTSFDPSYVQRDVGLDGLQQRSMTGRGIGVPEVYEVSTHAQLARSDLDRSVGKDFVSRTTVETQIGHGVTDKASGITYQILPEHHQRREDVYESWPHQKCDRDCSFIAARERMLEERQRLVDEYYLTKGMNYFDICTCCLSCVLRGLRKDYFVRSTATSAALFAIGIKLCCELNHWRVPTYAS